MKTLNRRSLPFSGRLPHSLFWRKAKRFSDLSIFRPFTGHNPAVKQRACRLIKERNRSIQKEQKPKFFPMQINGHRQKQRQRRRQTRTEYCRTQHFHQDGPHRGLKEKIAKKAALLVEDGDVIFMAASSTTFLMIPELVNKEGTVVTNGLSLSTSSSCWIFPA